MTTSRIARARLERRDRGPARGWIDVCLSLIAPGLLLLGTVFVAHPTSADPWCYAELQTCRDHLFLNDNMVAADNCFDASLNIAPPCDQAAAAFRAVTRVLRFPEDPTDPIGFNNSWQEILDRFGISAIGRSIYHLGPRLPKNGQKKIDLPSNSPRGNDIQETIQTLGMVAAIDTSIAQLEAIPESATFSLLPQELAGIGIQRPSILELDSGDRHALIGTLHFMKADLLLALSYDLDVDIDDYTPFVSTIEIQSEIIDAHPLLLSPTINACLSLTDAKAAYQAGIDEMQLAWQSISSEVDLQYNDFVTLDCMGGVGRTLDCDDMSEYLVHADAARASMDGWTRILNLGTPNEVEWIETLNRVVGTTFPTSGPDKGAEADLSALFSCSPVYSWRDGDALPLVQYDSQASPTNFIDTNSFVDKTFGGILVPVPEPTAAHLVIAGALGLRILARMKGRGRGRR